MKSTGSKLLEKHKDTQMKYFQNIVLIVLSVCLLSCETSVDASDLLDKQQLVVINGYLSPQDTVLKVQVSKSKSRASTINNKDLVIKDATVMIADKENNKVELTYTDTSLSYEVPAGGLAIISGKKYFLTVMIQGKEYKAFCTIPATSVQKIEQKIQVKEEEFLDKNRLLKITIEDIKDQKNFYVIGASVTQFFDNGSGANRTTVENIDFEFKQFATDVSRENSVITADGFFRFDDNALPNPKLKIQVTNTEKILYEALRATFLNKYNDGDPFSESVIIPSNIEGENGFGVFAGYQLTEMEETF